MPEFVLKNIAGKNVLYLMAAQQEYGAALKQSITPCFIGVGPVESAVNTTGVIADLKTKGTLPDYVVSLGSAGSATLERTGIYQASSVSYRDMDATALGFEKGQTPLIDLPIEIELPVQVEGLQAARLSTGANVVSGGAYDLINADMVDMETFAILRACMRFDLPLIALRGISDGKQELEKFEDWTEYLELIDVKLADAVCQVERHIASENE